MPPAYWSADPVRAVARFWSWVDKSGDCWLWTGDKNREGYGRFATGPAKARKKWMAHRFAWTIAHGPIPDGLFACHRCDNPPCVRPDHLFLGDQRANAQDCVAKNRHSSRPELWAKRDPNTIPRGERHGMTKLTDAQVAELRAAYMPAQRGCKAALARRFGISKNHVGRLLAGNGRIYATTIAVAPVIEV